VSSNNSGDNPTLSEEVDDSSSSIQERLRAGARQVLVAFFLLVLAAALWELAKVITGSNDRTMPHIWDTLSFLGSTTSQNENYSWFLFKNAWSTAKASLIGLLVGTAFGLVTGTSIARSRFVGNGLMPLIVAAQAVPIVAIAPALVLWLGTGGVTKTVITTYLTFFPVTVATARGIQSVPKESHELLRTYGASKRTSLRILELPFASPLIFVGLETAAAFSVVGAIVAELPFGSKEGLGVVILTSWQFYIVEPRALYCVALTSCALGAVFVLSVRLMAYFALGPRSQGEVL